MGKSDVTDAVTPSSRISYGDGEVIQPSDMKRRDGDVALDFIEQHEGFQYTPQQERAVVRKIDLWLMPLVRVETT